MVNFSNLYKHWPKYQADLRSSSDICAIDSKLEQEFWDFVKERMSIFYKKSSGLPYPWSEDPILSKNKFCNIYRELDRTTVELHQLASPVLHDLELSLLNFSYMRWVGVPSIVSQVGLLDFSPDTLERAWEKFDSIEGVRFTNAYNSAIAGILSTGSKDRQEFIFSFMPKRIPVIAKALREAQNRSIDALCETLAPMFGFNARFMCAEILMDIGYQFPELVDEMGPMFIGPGAAPSVKSFNQKADGNKVLMTLMKTQPIEDVNPLIINDAPVFITVANLENVCCEFRKYKNLSTGTGLKGKTPRKRLYRI